MDHVAVDLRVADEAIATHAHVAVHVDAIGLITLALVVAYDRIISAVGRVDAMFQYATGAGVVLDGDMLRETGEGPSDRSCGSRYSAR